MQVVNEHTQAVCKVKFKEQGFLESVTHQARHCPGESADIT